MNANELADLIECACCAYQKEAAIMLRQQANRISELEKLVHQRFDDGKRLGVLETENKFKSPPCAWMVKTNDGKKLMLYGEEQPPKFADEVQVIPLYTHPVKEKHTTTLMESRAKIFQNEANKSHPVKELTDEDLEIITEALLMVGFTDAFINYELKEKALAILRKAQENG